MYINKTMKMLILIYTQYKIIGIPTPIKNWLNFKPRCLCGVYVGYTYLNKGYTIFKISLNYGIYKI